MKAYIVVIVLFGAFMSVVALHNIVPVIKQNVVLAATDQTPILSNLDHKMIFVWTCQS